MSNPATPIVVVVEDDFVDIELVKRGVAKRDLHCDLRTACEGQEALQLLRKHAKDGVKDELIVLLDINMPGMNGHQFLDALRADAQLRRTIVFVLTTSDHPQDKARAYDKNIAGYFVKSNLDGLLDILSNYTRIVEFPPIKPPQ